MFNMRFLQKPLPAHNEDLIFWSVHPGELTFCLVASKKVFLVVILSCNLLCECRPDGLLVNVNYERPDFVWLFLTFKIEI